MLSVMTGTTKLVVHGAYGVGIGSKQQKMTKLVHISSVKKDSSMRDEGRELNMERKAKGEHERGLVVGRGKEKVYEEKHSPVKQKKEGDNLGGGGKSWL